MSVRAFFQKLPGNNKLVLPGTIIYFIIIIVSSILFSCTKIILDNPDPCATCNATEQIPLAVSIPDTNVQNLSFRGIRPDDPGGLKALDNPERGFRFEFIMTAKDLINPYHGFGYADHFTNILQSEEIAYGNNKIKLAQVYFYLTDYLRTDIDVSAFKNMQYIFDQCKNEGIKIVLRFAYRHHNGAPYASLSDITRHLSALKNFLAKNESVIYIIQAGMLGKWGEWHHSAYDNDAGAQGLFIRELLKNIPPTKKIQLRETAFKSHAAASRNGYTDYIKYGVKSYYQYPALTNTQKSRIGFHNDYFVLDQGANAQWDYKWPDKDFYQAQSEAAFTAMDGEMPYDEGEGSFKTLAYGNEGGWYAARRMRAHAYTSFSIIHNFNTNIKSWKSQLLYPAQFRNDGTLVTDDYFLNQNGHEVPRKAFDYIRDHLGYRFQLRSAKIPARSAINSTARVEFFIKNFGFSRTVNARDIYIVLIDEQNHVTAHKTKLSTAEIFPTFGNDDGVYHVTEDVSINHTYKPGRYKIGIWIPDPSADLKYNNTYAIKLANANIKWWKDVNDQYLVNVIGEMEVY